MNINLTRSQRISVIIFRLVIKNFKRSPGGLTGPGNGFGNTLAHIPRAPTQLRSYTLLQPRPPIVWLYLRQPPPSRGAAPRVKSAWRHAKRHLLDLVPAGHIPRAFGGAEHMRTKMRVTEPSMPVPRCPHSPTYDCPMGLQRRDRWRKKRQR